MGAYINPQTETKEQFLTREGKLLKQIPAWKDVPDKMLPICLVDNGMFTAGAVLFSEQELKSFTLPSDSRPKMFYMVPVEKLKEVSPELSHYLR